MDHRAQLVERHHARRRIDADREHQIAAHRGAALDHPANQRQIDRLAGRRVDQTRRAGNDVQAVRHAARAVRPEPGGEQAREARAGIGAKHRLVDHQGRLGDAAIDPGTRAVVVERQVLADVDARGGGVAIPIGRYHTKGDEVVGAQSRTFAGVGVAGRGVDDRTLLIERHIPRAIHRNREHDRPARTGTSDNDAALQRQDDGIPGGGVGETRRASIDAERVTERIRCRWPVSAVAYGKSAGKALRVVGSKHGLVNDQNRLLKAAGNKRRIVFDRDRDRTAGRDIFAVTDADRDDDVGALLAAARGMVDRTQQIHRISASIVDRDGDNDIRSGGAGDDMPIGAHRPHNGHAGGRQRRAGNAQGNRQRIPIRIRNRDNAVRRGKVGGIRRADSVGKPVDQPFFRYVDRRKADYRRVVILFELAQFLEIGRRIAKLGRRQQVAERNARIERRDRHFEIAAAAQLIRRLIAGRRTRLGTDQQRREVGRGHFDSAKHELRNENGAIDDDHGRSIGQGHDEIPANDVDVAELDTGGERHDAVRTRHNARAVRGQFREVANVDHQPRRIGRAGLVRQCVMESVGHAGGRAGVAFVAVITAGIDAERAILAMHRELAAREAAVASASAVDRGDLPRAGAGHVEPGRAGDGADPGNHITGGGAIITRREMICIVARIDLARSRLGSIFVSHNPPSPLPSGRMTATADCDFARK